MKPDIAFDLEKLKYNVCFEIERLSDRVNQI